MEVITTKKGHQYIYEQKTGYMSLAHDMMAGNDKISPDSYYKEKLEYLQRHGLIEEKTCSDKYCLLTEDNIRSAIFNTHQIIFEVTDKCNLKCHYCGYGDFYENYDRRLNSDMDFSTFKALYDYLREMWNKSAYQGSSYLRISFYGGEPLCNFALIKDAVLYTKENPIKGKTIIYSMTTNAVLLEKHMSFLVENGFDILISLDGNKYNDSYRIFKNGNSSFDKVVGNVKQLQSEYPSYFRNKVEFNCVLHDRNSIKECEEFIYSTFHKHPMINELNVFGIAKEKRCEFNDMFRSKVMEYSNLEEKEKNRYGNQSPCLVQYEKWLYGTPMMNFGKSLAEALLGDFVQDINEPKHILPTKTCVPFSKKIFVSVSGKIYPCERIGNEFDFGYISSSGDVVFNYKGITDSYNRLYKKYLVHCTHCKIKEFCSVCVVSDITGYDVCEENNQRLKSKKKQMFSYFEEYPGLLDSIFKNVTII